MAAADSKSSSSTDSDELHGGCVVESTRDGSEEGEITGEADSGEAEMAAAGQLHPLEHSWTFWFDNPAGKSKQTAWGVSIRPIYTFSTVEEFWSLFNHLHYPSKLAVGADIYCFKNNIEPKWEDPVCANGGKWTQNFNRAKSDTCWLYSLLAMIGEQFDHSDEICGLVFNIRARQEKISLWTKNASNDTAMVSIGKQWKEFLDNNETIGFICHDDAGNFGKSARMLYKV